MAKTPFMRLVRQYIKFLLDLSMFTAALALAYVLTRTPGEGLHLFTSLGYFLPLFILVKVGAFRVVRLHRAIWRYSSVHELTKIIQATSIATITMIVVDTAVPSLSIPRLVFFIDWLLTIFLSGGLRLVIRRIFETYLNPVKKDHSIRKVLIYGGGRAGELLLRNIRNSKDSGLEVVGILDDDPVKRGRRIHNVPVIGDGSEIKKLVKEYKVTDIYFAISAISGYETRRLLQLIHEQVGGEVEVMTIPGLKDLVDGRVTVNQLRKIEIRDLLRRPPVELDRGPVANMIQDQRVLVVGGGGSIGSELCFQIAQFEPEQLIVMDQSEFNLYKMEAQLSVKFPNLDIRYIVLDACKEPLVRRVYEEYRPHHVFHAAAYKHVPLMEENPWSAIQNNLTSTLVLSELSAEFGVERFVLISTDKAVQPTNVMGASKRVCELISLSKSRSSKTKFMAVRFGNVLGSSGSAIPKFQEQIQNGGPITVTHPDISRYFMLVSEAVELVLQAGSNGESGNIYVLDMGEPIRIVELARYMIKLSGLKENEDMRIVYTGLRPGEKLHESLYLEGEECNTNIPGLLVLNPHLQTNGEYIAKLRTLLNTVTQKDHHEVREALRMLVPEYKPQDFQVSRKQQEKEKEKVSSFSLRRKHQEVA